MDIRLIAFDLDGTLLRSDKSISPRTMQALLAARERGVLLVPSTGRLLRSLPEPLLDKNLTRYHILVNGAQVYDSFEDKTLLLAELLHFLGDALDNALFLTGLGRNGDHIAQELGHVGLVAFSCLLDCFIVHNTGKPPVISIYVFLF